MKITFKSQGGSVPCKLPRSIQKILDVCDAIPDGDVIDNLEMVKLSGVAIGTLSNIPRELIASNRATFRGKAWFGNSRTIAALKKQSK